MGKNRKALLAGIRSNIDCDSTVTVCTKPMKLLSIIEIFRDLNDAGVKYLVAGGIAVIAHGYARLTMDIDMIVNFAPDNIRAALNVFSRLGYRPRIPVTLEEFADETVRRGWITDKNMVVFSLIHPESASPVIDLFVEVSFDFDEEYEHSEAYLIGADVSVPIVRLKTLIAMKRKAGREKDLADIEALQHFLTEHDDARD